MALRGATARSVSRDGKRLMTAEEFKDWLMKFDTDEDGRISRRELRHAMRSCNGWLSAWRELRRAMSEADANHNGYIDEQEIDCLLDFAETYMGIKFVY